MTIEERIIHELQLLQKSDDTEIAHYKADDLLCEFIHQLGYTDVVEEYSKIEKWYA